MWLLLLLLTGFVQSKVTPDDLISMLHNQPDETDRTTILANHQKLTDENYHPNDPTRVNYIQLAYVTPWNNHGYDLARKTVHKLTHVSPVWFQATPSAESHGCLIHGVHDVDRDWIADLRSTNPKIKIVPRIIFENWHRQDLNELLLSPQIARECAKDVADFYKRNEFDGAVIEFYLQALGVMRQYDSKVYIIEAMEQFAKVFKKSNLDVIYTVPATLDANLTPTQLITDDEFTQLCKFSDFVQIMTYDYRSGEPAGVAPYDWVENNLYWLGNGQNPKILLGLNYYGYEFKANNVEAITSNRFLEALKQEDSAYTFDKNAMEHKLRTKNSIIYYPSISSLEIRMNLAHRYRAGIAIWDYGQGLDYFTNLLV